MVFIDQVFNIKRFFNLFAAGNCLNGVICKFSFFHFIITNGIGIFMGFVIL